MPHTSGSNTSNCHSHARGHQPHPTGTTKLVATNHIQLPPPNTWVPITSNNHCTHVGTKHIQLSSPYTCAPTKSNCYCLTRVPRTTPNCHSHNCGHKPHQTGTTNLVGTNLIQLSWPHTWASNTSNCHSHTRGHQPHPTGTTRFVSTNHIQLPCPHT